MRSILKGPVNVNHDLEFEAILEKVPMFMMEALNLMAKVWKGQKKQQPRRTRSRYALSALPALPMATFQEEAFIHSP